MPIYRNGTRVTAVSYNSTTLKRVVYNDTTVWGNFTATFAGLSGAVPSSYTAQVRLDDEQVTSPGSPTKTGYTFTGWSPSLPCYIDIDYVFTAQWTINYYDVTFKNWDNTQIGATQSIAYGSNATPPANPTRATDAQYTYAFSGWSPGYTVITSNRDCIAQYTPTLRYYNVYFRDWNSTLLDTDNVGYGSAATYGGTTPSRTGYTWTGWNASFSYITGELTVYATYTINYYTVTFKDWDGTTIGTPQSIAYLSNATPPANPTRASYTFDSWSGVYTNVTSDRTITAVYYLYAFNSWSTWVNNSTCSASGPTTCTDGTYLEVQTGCQCLWTAWSGWTTATSAEAYNQSCFQDAEQMEVQESVRSCFEDSYSCNPHDCNPYECNPYDCNPYECDPYDCDCTCQWTYVGNTSGITYDASYTNGCLDKMECGSYQDPYNCNPYDCHCWCSWEMYEDGMYPSDESMVDGCNTKVECIYIGPDWYCQISAGTTICDTCYETCYNTLWSCDEYTGETVCDTCYDTCYETCYETCYQTCYDTCYYCDCGTYSAYSDTTGCHATYYGAAMGACEGEQYIRCQTRTTTGYLQSRSRTCLRT